MSILAPSDFTGKFAISKAFNDGNSKIQEYIDHYEKIYLNDLFGAELCKLFIAGYVSTLIYTKLFDPFEEDICNDVVISEGVEIMLKCFIYAHYQREDLGVSTSTGNVIMNPEGGQKQSDNYNVSFTPYNQGIKTYRAIQAFINDNKKDYPSFNGKDKQTTWYI